jgi:hypothetical protein
MPIVTFRLFAFGIGVSRINLNEKNAVGRAAKFFSFLLED